MNPWILFISALLLSCVPSQKPSPAPVVDAGATCQAWCDHARALNCPSGKPTTAGATCEAVCLNVQDAGFTGFDLKCRVAAASCAAADECEKGK